MTSLTLLRQGSRLADPAVQLEILDRAAGCAPFDHVLAEHHCPPLTADGISVLQVNVGKLCNQTCRHCHVDAGPDRREVMTRETADACLRVLDQAQIPTLDITGGAPEMNPQFRHLVVAARELDRYVIDRCNLTILMAPGYEDLAEFLADHQVEVVASLPCYLEENTDAQRGRGVFARSVAALRKLNALGYGTGREDRRLTLVFNPQGATLPPAQATLEAAYRSELQSRYDVRFDRLFTITNLPISRFLQDLLEHQQLDEYLALLARSFNPTATGGVMCRTTLSVDWQGNLYDCDFNQMLELPLSPGSPRHIRDFELATLHQRAIATNRHCLGCTAGSGSGCTGAIVG